MATQGMQHIVNYRWAVLNVFTDGGRWTFPDTEIDYLRIYEDPLEALTAFFDLQDARGRDDIAAIALVRDEISMADNSLLKRGWCLAFRSGWGRRDLSMFERLTLTPFSNTPEDSGVRKRIPETVRRAFFDAWQNIAEHHGVAQKV